MSKLFIISIFLLTAGCADWFEKDKKVVIEDVYVPSLYDMGCSGFFSNIELGKNNSVSGTFPNEKAIELRCNSDVYVTVDFYDFTHPGHYRYFTVNNTPVTYNTTLYSNGYESSGMFTFSTDRSIQTYGTYYGKYEIMALNLETRRYTVQQYLITAYENGPYSKEVPAVSTFKAKPAPVLDKNTESADNITSVNVDNATLN